jgi:hypothetical protein
MPPTTDTKEAGSINPITGRTRTGGTYDTATRSAIPQAPVNASNVPASVLSTPTPELQMPPAPIVPMDTGAVAEGRTLLDQETARAQQAAQQATQTVSESEQAVRGLFGMTQTEAQTRQQLEGKAGVEGFSQDLRKFQESLRRQVAELDQFDVDNVNTLEQMRVDASRRDITKRTFSAMSAEANIQMAVERANKVASTRATIAAIDVTQGNLQAATEQVDKALKAIYEPIRQQLQMEMFFLERNDRRFDAAQKDLANTRMMQIQREQAQMDRATINAEAAVATGFATPDEVMQLTQLAGDFEGQNKLAQQIIGRASRSKIQQEQAAISASRSASAWNQRAAAYDLAMNGDPAAIEFLGFDPRQSNMTLQDSFNFINATAEDDRILNNLDKVLVSDSALAASTGVSRFALGTAAARFGLPSAGVGAVVGSKVPVAGTILGGVGGFVAGTAGGYVKVANEKKELLGALSSLSNTAAFTKLREYKEAGISFGQLTEAERIAIGRAATDLFSVLTINNDGTVSGINTSAKDFKRLVENYRQETEIKKQQKAQIFSGLTPADAALIDGL